MVLVVVRRERIDGTRSIDQDRWATSSLQMKIADRLRAEIGITSVCPLSFSDFEFVVPLFEHIPYSYVIYSSCSPHHSGKSSGYITLFAEE